MTGMRVARRTVLQAASAGALTALLGRAAEAAGATMATARAAPDAAADPVRLRFTRATNGAATAVGDRVVAEVRGVLWSLPPDGTPATPLTPPDPARPPVIRAGRTRRRR
ncbi:hypothetical protein ACIF8W_32540 [Streptomyces sp. NPDC085639]|uniref:hypothetical protein n=1 Tax=Streptomyces sp. NPDC085639 TaxID=3365734 RepID=UPI0037D87F79